MSRMQRNKGKRCEREVVELAKEAGLTAIRCWQTAQSLDPVERKCDVLISSMPHQVKCVGRGLSFLYRAIDGVAAAFVRQNGEDWLAVLPAHVYLDYLKFARQYDLPKVN